jgi:hypothetical protein
MNTCGFANFDIEPMTLCTDEGVHFINEHDHVKGGNCRIGCRVLWVCQKHWDQCIPDCVQNDPDVYSPPRVNKDGK